MRHLLVLALIVATIFFTGCVSESREKDIPVIPSTVKTTSAIPTTPTQKMVVVTTVVTTNKVQTPTMALKKPIESPFQANGTSGKIMRFYTVAPGTVKITFKYGGGKFDKNREGCAKEDRASIRLVGASIDTSLYNGATTSKYSETTTYNLVSPGNYSLTTRGCYDWRVDIDNA